MPFDFNNISEIYGCWIYSFLRKAYTHGVNDEDIPALASVDICANNTKRLEQYWNEEVRTKGVEKASFTRACIKCIWKRSLVAMIFTCLKVPFIILSPLIFMRYFIEWLSMEDAPVSYGIIAAICFMISEIMKLTSYIIDWALTSRTAARLQAACFGLLYQKVLKMPNLGGKSAGEIINLFANDGKRICDFATYVDMIHYGPLVAVSAITYILLVLGPSSLIGIIYFFLFCPLQVGLARITSYNRKQTVAYSDKRVKLITEIISSIQLIKMYAWEENFEKNVEEIRAKEEKYLKYTLYVHDMSLSLALLHPVVACIMIFLSYTLAGNNLTAAKGLPILSLIMGPVQHAFHMVRISTQSTIEGIESFKRYQDVLIMDERENYVQEIRKKDVGIDIRNATFAYASNLQPQKVKKCFDEEDLKSVDTMGPLLTSADGTGDVEAIEELTLKIRKGSLVGICGSIGAGKTSLLRGILSQMKLLEGTVRVNGSIAYVSQQAWILNATLKENILMGIPLISERYNQVIYACGLTQDISMLPDGDNCEIGEKGINLSGGQKQRVSLARALYADRDVYLLDDPLSAVDPRLGKHVFHWAIEKELQTKTVILISHHLQYFVNCDHVFLLSEGRVLESGTHTELVAQEKEYSRIYTTHMRALETARYGNERILPAPCIVSKENVTSKIRRSRKEPTYRLDGIFVPMYAIIGRIGFSKSCRNIIGLLFSFLHIFRIGKLMKKELIEKGEISPATYHSYIQYAGGYFAAGLVVLSFMFNVATTTFSSWWLADWISHGSGWLHNNTHSIAVNASASKGGSVTDNPDHGFYQLVYGLTIVFMLIASVARGFCFTMATLRSSSRLHNKVFKQILRCPMSYFDSIASGQIINLFSRDINVADEGLPKTLECIMHYTFITLAIIVTISYVFPYIIPVLLVIGFSFFFIWKRVSQVMCEVQRLHSSSCSPLYSHLNTTVHGISSILAYGKEELFLNRFQQYFDRNNQLSMFDQVLSRWVSLRLIALSWFVQISTVAMGVILKDNVDHTKNALAFSYSIAMASSFQFAIRMTNDLQDKFISIERLFGCIKNLASEAPAVVSSSRPGKNWSRYGRISFRDVWMRYRPRTPLVLNGISFEIESQEKIGIIGRTGSGKSSLGVALFRLVELCKGNIYIDSVNISSIGLKDLRSRLSVIPQDPILFNGTIRYNLDPFDDHSDTDLWEALEKTFMKSRILSLDQRLASPVFEDGKNYSIGERQLLCLARALLRNSKILFLDEATAGIDAETDSLIQETLQKSFSHCTVLTVAHRLNTVLNCSRILVIENGEVIEYDTPSNLLNRDSFFSKLVRSTDAIHDQRISDA